MGAAGVWFVMVTALLSVATEQRCPPLLYKLVCVNTIIHFFYIFFSLRSQIKASLLVPLSSSVRFLQIGLWMLTALVLLVVCMSRVYMAAHFPHQVIAGVVTG